ncbi:MAG: hypothetical protein ACXQT5_05445 [Candidatus Syntropharchaeia archaeon]
MLQNVLYDHACGKGRYGNASGQRNKNRNIMMSVIGTMKIQNKDFFTAEYILSRLS